MLRSICMDYYSVINDAGWGVQFEHMLKLEEKCNKLFTVSTNSVIPAMQSTVYELYYK